MTAPSIVSANLRHIGRQYLRLQRSLAQKFRLSLARRRTRAAMTAVAQAESGDFNMGQQLEASAPIRAGWYCAVLEYAAGGEARTLQSGTVRYAEDGTRL